MSYQVLALKYRPQTFDQVVGQSHVTTTLSNAIASDRVAHAILFTGPRGTGKTTIARILAKAMNCRKGPTASPCNACDTCKQIIDGHCTDVFEIDGASNNSVDQIRDLRENVTYMPSSAAFKIYIIDEVHMLSTAAFNALLKTLEEPPDHVMFIFATTEVHKIPATILSRCQRHDLGRIGLNLISGHLKELCQKEGFAVEDQTIDLIAQEADGSIRDSLSLLDRILSSSGQNTIAHEDVLDTLGILDRQIVHHLSRAVFESKGKELIELVERVNDSGLDLKKFYSDIILHFRNLNVIKLCGKDGPASNISGSEKEKIEQAVKGLSADHINRILQTLLEEESVVRYSSHTKSAIEMVLLKLIRINPGEQIDQIIGKLDILARKIGSGQISGQASDQMPDPETPLKKKTVKPAGSTPPAPTQKPSPEPQIAPEPGSGQRSATWAGFLKEIETGLPFMHALLLKGQVKQQADDSQTIVVELSNCTAFDKKRIESKKNELENRCRQFLRKELRMEVICDKKKPSRKKTVKAKQAAFNHPLVVEAQKIFDGEIINY